MDTTGPLVPVTADPNPVIAPTAVRYSTGRNPAPTPRIVGAAVLAAVCGSSDPPSPPPDTPPPIAAAVAVAASPGTPAAAVLACALTSSLASSSTAAPVAAVASVVDGGAAGSTGRAARACLRDCNVRTRARMDDSSTTAHRSHMPQWGSKGLRAVPSRAHHSSASGCAREKTEIARVGSGWRAHARA
jgi:hypothetical protein